MEQAELVDNKNILSLTRQERFVIKVAAIRDRICDSGILIITIISAVIVLFIFGFILSKSWQIFKINGLSFITGKGFDQQIIEAFTAPAGQPVWHFGVVGLLIGTLATTIGALIIAIPAGLGTAIVISELAPNYYVKSFIQTVIRLLASIPSIIYGLVGLLAVVPFISRALITNEMQIQYIPFFQLTGNSMLAGILVLSIMIIPVIVALSADAINAVPKKYKEAGLALGLSHWRTIVRVIIPAAKSGILAGIILATGRAVGEAIALSMVTGGIGNIPNPAHGFVYFLTPVLTLASAIVNKAESMSTPSIEAALFACGVVLLVTCALLSIFTKIVEVIVKRREGIE